MGTVWTIIGWGVVAVLGLMLLSLCFVAVVQAIVMLPAALALAWGLFFLGLPVAESILNSALRGTAQSPGRT